MKVKESSASILLLIFIASRKEIQEKKQPDHQWVDG